MRKSIGCILALCSMLLLHPLTIAQSNKVEVVVQLSKQKYLKCEPIFVTVSVVNSTGGVVTLDKKIDFHVMDAAGREYFHWAQNITTSHRSKSMDSLTLKPDSVDSHSYDLLPFCSEGITEFYNFHTKHYFERGSYTVEVAYKMNDTKIKSTVVEFTVEEPQGRELEAYEMLVRATDNQIKYMATDVLDSLIQKFPQSDYNVLAYMQKMQMYEWSDKRKEQEIGYMTALGLIEAHPESEAADLALTQMLVRSGKILKTPEERKEVLKKIAQKYPKTRVGKRALEDIEKIRIR